MKAAEPVCRVLEALGAPYALVGGHAVGARGFPRMTVDYDFLTSDERVLEAGVWSELQREGALVDARRGDLDDPLAGVVHLGLRDGVEADVIVARWQWQADVIARAERLDLGGIVVPVPRTSDLILLKLAAGGLLDLQDVVALLEVCADRERVVAEVEARVVQLEPAAGEAWQRLRSARAR